MNYQLLFALACCVIAFLALALGISLHMRCVL